MADHKPVPVAVGKQSLTERKRVKFEKLYTVKGVECNERSSGEVVWRRKMRDKMGWSGGKVRVERVFRCERKADNEGRSSKRVSRQEYRQTVKLDGQADVRATGVEVGRVCRCKWHARGCRWPKMGFHAPR